MATLYFHIPFCKRICTYCDFYKVGAIELIPRVVEMMHHELEQRASYLSDRHLTSIYFGGGTPSYFGAENLDNILDEIHRNFHVSIDPEITVEANPDSLDEKTLKRLLKAGFNRLSMGVQSHNDEVLQQLGRPHTFQQAKEAMELARKVGFCAVV